MITNAPIRRAKEDKKCHRSCQSKNPKMTHSSFWSREFSGHDVLFVVGSTLKTAKAADKMKMVTMMKRPCKMTLRLRGLSHSQVHSHLHLQSFSQSVDLARIATKLQEMHANRNTRARSLNNKEIKIPQGTIRPPKRNNNASNLSLQSPPQIFVAYLIYSKPKKASQATK